MDRPSFIKSLGLGTAGLILPSNAFINTRPVKIYDNYVRGLMHYSFSKVKGSIKEGDEIQLIRESDNPYDSFAVQVKYGEHRLGYLAAYENIVLANMLDSGVNLRGFVSQINLKRLPEEWFAVEVFTDLCIPSQKLIDNILSSHRADDAPDLYRL